MWLRPRRNSRRSTGDKGAFGEVLPVQLTQRQHAALRQRRLLDKGRQLLRIVCPVGEAVLRRPVGAAVAGRREHRSNRAVIRSASGFVRASRNRP